jgi:hypothetical protein
MAKVVVSLLAVPSKSSIRDITVWSEHVSKQVDVVAGVPHNNYRTGNAGVRSRIFTNAEQTSIWLFSFL